MSRVTGSQIEGYVPPKLIKAEVPKSLLGKLHHYVKEKKAISRGLKLLGFDRASALANHFGYGHRKPRRKAKAVGGKKRKVKF